VKDWRDDTEGAKLKGEIEKKNDKDKELTQRQRLSWDRYHSLGSATWQECRFDIEKARHLWYRRRVVLSCTRSIWAGVSGQRGKNVSSCEHLVSPQKFIPEPVLETIPCVEKLGDPMASYMVGEVLCLVPVEWCSERQETHDSSDYDETQLLARF
jgi:hypothetical protein